MSFAICIVAGFVPGVLLGLCHAIDLKRGRRR